MPTSTNIPSIITLSPALFQAMGELLQKRESHRAISTPEALTVSRGKTSLCLSQGVAQNIQQLSSREISHLMAMIPKVMGACFHLARRDFLAGQLLDGQFYFARANPEGKISHLLRIAKVLGHDPTCKVALRNITRAIGVLHGSTLTRTYKSKRKGKSKQERYESLIDLVKDPVQVKGINLEEGSRGGNYFIAQINPRLFNLAIPTSKIARFVPVPDECFELDNKSFNTVLAVLSQTTLRKVGAEELEMTESRLVLDAALTQSSQSSSVRAKTYLKRSIERLVAMGIITARRLSEAGKWALKVVALDLNQGSLNQGEPEPGKFEHPIDPNQGSLNTPHKKPSSGRSDFKQACQNLTLAFLNLSKTSQKEVLEGFSESFPIGQLLKPHKKGTASQIVASQT